MSDRIAIGAIGVGERLSGQLQRLLKKHGDCCELVAVSDESKSVLDKAKLKFGSQVATYTNYEDLLDHPDVSWVMIGSPNFLHRDHIVSAFTAGKNVYCEKPLGITIDQCEEVKNAHRTAGTHFFTGFVLRYAPLYRNIRRLVTDGRFGKIVSIEANENLHPDHGAYFMRTWRRKREWNGPHLLEKCSHDIDLLNWMADDIPTKVASFGGNNVFTPENKYVEEKLGRPDDKPALFRGWPTEEDLDPFTSEKDTVDNQVCILQYRNGVRATFHSNCCSAFPERRLMLLGLEGALEADLISGKIRYKRIGRHDREEVLETFPVSGYGGADEIIMDELFQCMSLGKEPAATGEDGIVGAITCICLDEAMREQKTVDLEAHWKRFGF